MVKNTLTYVIVGLMLVFLVGCQVQMGGTEESETNADAGSDQMQSGNGRAVFVITDAAADMGSVTSVKITIDSIKVHSESEGWVDVSSNSETYDLLQLKAEGKNELLADIELKEGNYDEIKLDISKVVVTDAQGEHEAKLPSGELKIKSELNVESNLTSSASFDFVADESLHVTGNGRYIMAPVIVVETRENADVEIKSGSSVEVKSGRVRTNVKIGMDLDGNIGIGVKVPSNLNLSVGTDGSIGIGANSKGNIGVEI